ncbi:MAG: hypothetical protein IH849_06495 [Acidobacteria bacterium]|nr:hypothetical protein [Acidobacteriota bacterium]
MSSTVVPAAFVAGLILLPAAPAFAQEQPLGARCRELRTLDAMEYWFWDAFSGLTNVIDVGQERLGRLAVDPNICFRIAVVTLENPQQKNAGIRQAVSELIMWLAGTDLDKDSAERAMDQLERITGEEFDTYAEWTGWWEPRSDFVLWSDEEDRLIVVASAMEAGEPIHDEAMLLTAEEYWFYAGRGWILESEPVGTYVLGTVLIPPHDLNFRIEATDLDGRGAKERGFRRALGNMIVDGLLSPELRGDSLGSIIEQIATLTEENYVDRDSWVAWWNTYGGRLVLSASGDRLIVRR